jgi:hypothetical protein
MYDRDTNRMIFPINKQEYEQIKGKAELILKRKYSIILFIGDIGFEYGYEIENEIN